MRDPGEKNKILRFARESFIARNLSICFNCTGHLRVVFDTFVFQTNLAYLHIKSNCVIVGGIPSTVIVYSVFTRTPFETEVEQQHALI